MKKSILLLFATVLFLACENTETYSTALQANLDADFFRAYSVTAQANNVDQMITIIGTSSNEEFMLQTEWKGAGLYEITHDSPNYATFTGLNGVAYTTRSPGSLGYISIETDDVDSQKLTGKFDFTFITANDTIKVNRGLFYAVPYEIVDIVAD